MNYILIGVIKDGRKIAGYRLRNALGQIIDVNKEQTVKAIENGTITNAKVQWYNGNSIVRTKEKLPICNRIINKADSTEPEKKTNNKDNKVYTSIDVLNILKNLEEGTPLKISFTSEENYKQALFMGCKEASFGMLEYYFYDGSIFKFSEWFISNNKSMAVILNNNDAVRVAQLIKMLNQ